MEEQNRFETRKVTGSVARGVWAMGVALVCVVALSLGYVFEQHSNERQLANKNQELAASLNQTQGQLGSLSNKLNSMQAEEQAREQAAARAEAHHRAVVRRYAAQHHSVAVRKDDPRWKQFQTELEGHQKAIDANQQALNSTRQDLAKARSDLQGSLDSTRTELSGSIAKNHSELAALERKGERNYYEFDLNKSKQYARVGPIEVSLRKASVKHQFCNLAMLVDDKNLSKKHVNLYEPIMFYTDESAQPVELVINQISKSHMHGYVSEPKYKTVASTASNVIPGGRGNEPANPDALEHRTESMK